MQYLTTLLGDGKPLLQIVLGLAAALLVLLIAVALYRAILGRRIRGAAGGRARQPRLGVVDAYELDRQRQLVLIRRDNVEHLVMIGGPNDILIESTISRVSVPQDARAQKDFAAADAAVEPPAPMMTPPVIAVAPAAPSAAPQPVAPPAPAVPVPPPPPAAPSVVPPPAAPQGAAPVVAPPPAARPGPFVPPPPPQPRPLTPRPLTPSTVSRAGPTLQPRPEPGKTEPSKPEPPKPAPAPAPVAKPAPAPVAARVEPKVETKIETKPGLSPRPEPKPVEPAAKEPDPLDALEEEMAKLLGRPTDKM